MGGKIPDKLLYDKFLKKYKKGNTLEVSTRKSSMKDKTELTNWQD